MDDRRRRTDGLTGITLPDDDGRGRAEAACAALTGIGCGATCAVTVQADGTGGSPLPLPGADPSMLTAAIQLAVRAVRDGRASRFSPTVGLLRIGVAECARSDGSHTFVAVADPALSEREVQAIAAWAAPEVDDAPAVSDGSQGMAQMTRSLAKQFGADAVAIALFAPSGMLVNLHTRAGAVLHAWRSPIDTVWGEAARIGSAITVGEPAAHDGLRPLASIGMREASIAGIATESGLPLGSIGVASASELHPDTMYALIERAAELGPAIMQFVAAATPPPAVGADGTVDLRLFARRVGCRRFALYARHPAGLQLVSAHAEDGSLLVSPPDPEEEQLVLWALKRGVALSTTHAAAVLVGGETVLYAQDPRVEPMECLRRALSELRQEPGKAA